MNIVITTCQTYPDLPDNLHPLQRLLEARGDVVQIAPWQQCPSADLILPFCAWDYAAYPDQFARWLTQPDNRFPNGGGLMRWNMHKSYLVDLAARGADVIPTQILPADADVLRCALAQYPQGCVMKPAIGQSGGHVMRLLPDDALPDLQPYQRGVVMQPFVADVLTQGETSLIFFNGEYSHAVHRRPPPQEWRANSAYGVQIFPAKPSVDIVRAAENVLRLLPQMPVYARVDGTISDERFLINEVELIEPALYLHQCAGAVERLVAVIE